MLHLPIHRNRMGSKLIDVEKLIKQKNPGLLKWLPKFVVNYLKRILHQEEINYTLETNSHIIDQDFCKLLIDKFEIKVKVHGLENVPKSGGSIFVSNHPLGGMDAIALVHAIAPIRKDIKFIVNDVLLHLNNLKNLFVGINKFGDSGKGALQGVNDLFASDKAVFIFPAGLVSRKIGGKVRDLEWKKTFVSQALKTNKPIVPIFLDGELSNFFYRLHKVRSFLGLKANIEMLYLADELFKQKGKTIDIYFGTPIKPEEIDQKKSHRAVAQEIKEIVYSLK